MDVKKVCSYVVSKVKPVQTKVTGFMVAATVCVSALLCGGNVFAAPADVDIAVPEINYPGIATSVMAALTPALVAAIGLGLSIWAISFIYRKFKSMGK